MYVYVSIVDPWFSNLKVEQCERSVHFAKSFFRLQPECTELDWNYRHAANQRKLAWLSTRGNDKNRSLSRRLSGLVSAIVESYWIRVRSRLGPS